MNNPSLSREKTIQILKNGTYYNPASKHYNFNSTNVVCDRCRKTGLDMCIGFESYDLCLQCVQDVNSQLKKQVPIKQPEIATYMQQDQFRPLTRMIQGQFATNMEQAQFKPQIKTNMEQAQFRPLTRMVQGQFQTYIDNSESDEECKTFMIQSQFRR